MFPRRPIVTSACLAAAMLALTVPTAAVEEANYARVNASLAAHHIAPRYWRLATAAKAFDRTVTELCRAAPPRDLAPARAAFNGAMDAWMDIEHIHHGPVELFMRKFRIHYWPDKGSRGARQIRQLLARKDAAVLSPDDFRAASVAVQGLPTAERLLFTEPSAGAIAAGTDGDYPCRLLGAISFNIADMAGGLDADWSGGTRSFVKELQNPGGGDARYEDHGAVTAEFVKGLNTSLITIADLKLDAVLGKTLKEAMPRRSESWRSGRSLRNIVRDIGAIRAMYEGEGGPGLKALLPASKSALADLLSRAFDQILATARTIDAPLARAVADPAKRPAVERLAKEIRALKQLVGGRLATALGTPLGFNALDGD